MDEIKTLTERELACYVGTGVKVRHYWELPNGDRQDFDFVLHFEHCPRILAAPSGLVINETFQLILRPLSDLTKPCLEGGKVPIEVLFMRQWDINELPRGTKFRVIERENPLQIMQSYFVSFENLEYGMCFQIFTAKIRENAHWVIEWLHENHFDTQNLIGRNLAVDVNTIEDI